MPEVCLKDSELDRIIIINQVINGNLSQVEAGRQLKLSDRQVRRLVQRIKEGGFCALKSAHKGGNRAFSDDFKMRVLQALRDRYCGFGPTFASEKLASEGLLINRETLRHWMVEAGLWKCNTGRKSRIHQSRARRPRFGELVQIDGSHHDWFEGRRSKCCLIVFIDDATSRLVSLRFEESETSLGYMRSVQQHITTHGRPLAYYSDKHSIFKTTKEEGFTGTVEDTQFHRALHALNIELICAHSPQAKGRVERANQTLQDRLIKEMRLRNISDIVAANKYLIEFMEQYNKRFAVEPFNTEDAHRQLLQNKAKLRHILSIHHTRKLTKNLEFSFENRIYQLITKKIEYRLRGQKVTLCEHLDGSEEVILDGKSLKYRILDLKRGPKCVDTKQINTVMDDLLKNTPNNLDQTYPQGPLPPPALLAI